MLIYFRTGPRTGALFRLLLGQVGPLPRCPFFLVALGFNILIAAVLLLMFILGLLAGSLLLMALLRLFATFRLPQLFTNTLFALAEVQLLLLLARMLLLNL